MAIDQPSKVFGNIYYPESEDKSPLELVIFGGKLAFPKASIPLELFQRIYNRLTGISIGERMTETWKFLVDALDRIEDIKVDKEDLQEAIQIVMRRDADEFNDKKRERYVKLIGSAVRSEEQIKDITSFIQTLEQLNERDLIVLEALNKIMNQEGDWKDQHDPVMGKIAKLHPSTLLARAQELSNHVAEVLGQKTEGNKFSREEGFMICLRLQGFGLAREVQPNVRELPHTNYTFQLTVQGVRLLNLLGGKVPNYTNYMMG